MKNWCLIIVFLFIPILLFGNPGFRNKYKHKYRENLKAIPSEYTIRVVEGELNNYAKLVCVLRDKKNDTMFWLNTRIKGNNIDKFVFADSNGMSIAMLPPGIYDISFEYRDVTPLKESKFSLKQNTTTTITTAFGRQNRGAILLIYSKRKLKKEEIDKIVEDHSNHKEESNELIINKTCYTLFEL